DPGRPSRRWSPKTGPSPRRGGAPLPNGGRCATSTPTVAGRTRAPASRDRTLEETRRNRASFRRRITRPPRESMMHISLGSELYGSDGEYFGSVAGVVVDAQPRRATRLLIGSGPLGGNDRMADIALITSSAD